MDNYKVLFYLRVLKSVIASFVDSFLVLYFLDVSDRNIVLLGLYKLVSVVAIYAVIFMARNFSKSVNRIWLVRLGIVLDFVYFFLIVILREHICDYLFFAGIIYGLEEGFYFSVYNIIESDGVTNEQRARFAGSYTAVESVLSVVFPLLFGSLICTAGFVESLCIVFMIMACRIVLSFLYKDNNVPKGSRTDMGKYFELTCSDRRFRQMYIVAFLNGIVYSEAAFSYIVTIYVVSVFSDSFSLGVFTSVFSVLTFVIGILFVRFIQKKYYRSVIRFSMFFTVVFLFCMIIQCNVVTIVLFNFFYTISKKLKNLITGNNQADLSNEGIIAREYKTEYWLANETMIFAGRVISGFVFILAACFSTTAMVVLYAVFLVLFAAGSMRLQTVFGNCSLGLF